VAPELEINYVNIKEFGQGMVLENDGKKFGWKIYKFLAEIDDKNGNNSKYQISSKQKKRI